MVLDVSILFELDIRFRAFAQDVSELRLGHATVNSKLVVVAGKIVLWSYVLGIIKCSLPVVVLVCFNCDCIQIKGQVAGRKVRILGIDWPDDGQASSPGTRIEKVSSFGLDNWDGVNACHGHLAGRLVESGMVSAPALAHLHGFQKHFEGALLCLVPRFI